MSIPMAIYRAAPLLSACTWQSGDGLYGVSTCVDLYSEGRYSGKALMLSALVCSGERPGAEACEYWRGYAELFMPIAVDTDEIVRDELGMAPIGYHMHTTDFDTLKQLLDRMQELLSNMYRTIIFIVYGAAKLSTTDYSGGMHKYTGMIYEMSDGSEQRIVAIVNPLARIVDMAPEAEDEYTANSAWHILAIPVSFYKTYDIKIKTTYYAEPSGQPPSATIVSPSPVTIHSARLGILEIQTVDPETGQDLMQECPLTGVDYVTTVRDAALPVPTTPILLPTAL